MAWSASGEGPVAACWVSCTGVRRVRFYNAVELVNLLEKEKQNGRAGNIAKKLVQYDAVILDELGYLPFPASGGALLFHMISVLYEKNISDHHDKSQFRRMGSGVR
ncbi:hypothetical protein CCP1ISM_3160001 [Azospirillaceae bacterium]